MSRVCWCLLFSLVSTARWAWGADAPLLELKVGQNVHVGKSVVHNDQVCWLAADDGRLTEVVLKDVTSYRRLDTPFRSLTVVEARGRLAREFGAGFEIATAGPYAVAGPPGKAPFYANLLDGVHRAYTGYFSRRSFRLPKPEYPLLAVVFPDRTAFARYCRADGVTPSAGLRGYYHPGSNRFALFDAGDALSLQRRTEFIPFTPLGHSELSSEAQVFARELNGMNSVLRWGPFAPGSNGTIEADLKNTLVHEATHQLAFNTGLHSRIGESPRWIVEGLAMLLEHDAQRLDAREGAVRDRINPERMRWLQVFHRERRKPRSLESFIASDEPFRRASLDAYSEAWALTFYLAERRSADLAAYLRVVQMRDPLQPYSTADRLADFQRAFGKDVAWLEVQFLRFIDELQ
jgi:hypothetical protein